MGRFRSHIPFKHSTILFPNRNRNHNHFGPSLNTIIRFDCISTSPQTSRLPPIVLHPHSSQIQRTSHATPDIPIHPFQTSKRASQAPTSLTGLLTRLLEVLLLFQFAYLIARCNADSPLATSHIDGNDRRSPDDQEADNARDDTGRGGAGGGNNKEGTAKSKSKAKPNNKKETNPNKRRKRNPPKREYVGRIQRAALEKELDKERKRRHELNHPDGDFNDSDSEYGSEEGPRDIPNPFWPRTNEDHTIQVTPAQRKAAIVDYVNTVVETTSFDADFQKSVNLIAAALQDETLTVKPTTSEQVDEDEIIPLNIPMKVFGSQSRMPETFVPEDSSSSSSDENDEEAARNLFREGLDQSSDDDADDEKSECSDHPFHISLSIFWMAFNLSVQSYRAFWEIMQLLGPIDGFPPLPKSLVKLHKWADQHLPPSVMREGRIQLDTRGLPGGHPRALDPKDKLVYCDPIEMTKALFQNDRCRGKLYMGMQRLVERPIELWQSRAWGSSNRVSSGKYAYYPPSHPTPAPAQTTPGLPTSAVSTSSSSVPTTSEGAGPSTTQDPKRDPIFAGDIVEYTDKSGTISIGRVRQTCLDYKFENKGETCAFIDPICTTEQLATRIPPPAMQAVHKHIIAINKRSPEWFANASDVILLEESADFVYTRSIHRRLSFEYLDPRQQPPPQTPPAETSDTRPTKDAVDPVGKVNVKFIARYEEACPSVLPTLGVIQDAQVSLREAIFRHLLRGELEVIAYGREALVDEFAHSSKGTGIVLGSTVSFRSLINNSEGKVVSLPSISFWDAYGTFGKGTCMYISFLGGYSCLAGLPYAERMNVKNYHPHAMGPMGCDMRTVMGVMGASYRKLEDGKVYSDIDGHTFRLVSFDLAILGESNST